jgi:hypothetical protein
MIKKYVLGFFTLLFCSQQICASQPALAYHSIHKLSEADIVLAQKNLEQEAYHYKIARHAIFTGVMCAAALVLFKTIPDLNEKIKAQKELAKIKSLTAKVDLASLKQAGASKQDLSCAIINIAEQIQEQKDLIANAANPAAKSFFALDVWKGRAKSLLGGTASIAGMVALPIVAETVSKQTGFGNFIAEKTRKLFGYPSFKAFYALDLKLPEHFERLKGAQIYLAPNEFIQNVNHQNDPQLAYAKTLGQMIANLDLEKQIKLYASAKESLILECNILIAQVAYLIAFMRSRVASEASSVLLRNLTDQLFWSTHEFACKVQASLDQNNITELFNSIALYKSIFNVSVNNYQLLNS